jgi:plastocyanin
LTAIRPLLAAALLVVAACTATDQGGAPVATDQVDLPASYRFEPDSIVVTPGTTVTWTNSDNFTHSVQFDGESAPGLVLRPGEQVARAFDAPGVYPYVCTFHARDMQGTVTVEGG